MNTIRSTSQKPRLDVDFLSILLHPRTTNSTTVAVTQRLHGDEIQPGLMLHDAELADALTGVNDRVPHGDGREVPLVVVAAVALIEHPHVVGLNDAEVLVCRAAGNHMCLVAHGELHGDAQRNQLELSGLQLHILSGPQVNPVRLAADVLQLLSFRR